MQISRVLVITASLSLLVGAGLAAAAFELRDDLPKAWSANGYSFTVDVDVAGAPQGVFDAFTGDVTPWWDHTLSNKPKALFIEPKPGGSFMEVFDEAGNGVQHARVTGAERGKFLRMVGPLGLAGSGIDIEMTLTFKASGDKTAIHFAGNLLGNCDAAKADMVQAVWKHFLVERFEPYMAKKAAK